MTTIFPFLSPFNFAYVLQTITFYEAKFCPEFSRFFHCLKVNKSFPVVRFNKH